jgi:heme exporter protein B
LAVAFLIAAASLVPLSLGPAPGPLSAAAIGVTWVALVLATLLSLDRLFQHDLEDGCLDLLALGAPPLEAVCAVKCVASWLVNGAPLAVAAPAAAIALGAAPSSAIQIAVAALTGGIAFAFVGGAGAAIALVSRRGGVLMAVIVLPLLIPPVIFGGALMATGSAGASQALALLLAYALASVALAPFAMAAACRNALG